MADLPTLAAQAAQAAGVDPDLYASLIANGEGGFANPGAVSPKGAIGPAQLMPQTAQALGVDPTDPAQNLYGGAKYLRQQMDRFGDPALAVAAYNAGPSAVQRHGGVPPYPETQAYVRRVMGGVSQPTQADAEKAYDEQFGGGAGAATGGQPPLAANGGIDTFWNPDGKTLHDAAGNTYTPDGLDQRGVQHGVNHMGAPTQADAEKAYDEQFGGPGADAPPTPDNLLGQYARGVVESPLGLARGVAAVATPGGMFKSVLGQFGQAADNIASLIQGATGDGAKPPPLKNTFAPPQANLPVPGVDQWLAKAPRTAAGRLARTAGDMTVGALTANPEGGLVPMALRAAGNVVGPTLGSFGASESARALGEPPELQDLAGLAGAALGGGAVHAAPRFAAGAVTPLRGLVDPYAARFVPGAAEAQAGRYLNNAASDPAAAQAALANGSDQIVPGSQPTTFQQTGDMGLGAVERAVAAKNPDLFKAREAEQNNARVSALGGIQSGAQPQAVATHLKGVFDALDQRTQADVDSRVRQAQQAAQGIGGTGQPDEYGAQIRDAVNAAETAARQRESGLWQAIDPEGNLTGNTLATSSAAKAIAGQMEPTAKPMQGEEAAIFDAAQGLPAVAPVRDLIALRSRLSTEMRNELISNGRSPAYARMSQLRGAMQDNLAGSIGDAVASDQARVANGSLSPDAAIGARMDRYFGFTSEQSSPQTGLLAAGAAGPGNDAGQAASLRRVDGTEGAAGGGFRDASGNPGLAQAAEDIALLRRGQTGGLFRAMQELGGVRMLNPDGSRVPGPDVAGALQDVKAPGLVNNRSGLSPEQMAVALHERGFFGPNVADPSSAFEAALNRHASGQKVFPEADSALTAERIRQIDPDASAAGVVSSDRLNVAAQKLAAYRNARDGLLARAERFGVPFEGRDLHDVWGDTEERAALAADRGDPHGDEFDRLSGRTLVPTFDADAAQRLTAATEATKQRAATFGQPPVASVTASSGGFGQYRLPDGRVAGRFFHPGPTGYGDMQALLNASPEAAPAIQDYAASTLRRAALNPDGTIDPGKFQRWQAQHADAIRALPPEQQAKFANAASASQAVADAAVRRAQVLKDAQSGAVGKIMGAQSPEEVTGRLKTILNSPTRVSDMAALAKATAGNPDARAGLRQAVADHIAQTYIGNTEAATTGVGMMKADPFQTFVRQASPALSKVFSPKEMESLQAIADDLARAKRSQSAVKLAGSNTTQDAHGTAKLPGGGMTGAVASHGGTSLLGVIVGEHLLGHLGPGIGEAAGVIGSTFINALRSQGIGKVNDLITRAMLEPDVARALMQKAPKGQLTPKSLQGATLLRALSGSAAQPPRKDGSNSTVFFPPRKSGVPGPSSMPPRLVG